MRKFPAVMCFSFLVLTSGPLRAADKPDPNIDPVLPDPEPNNAYFPPATATATATAGTADPGPSLIRVPVSAAMLAGQGPDCTALSPCGVDSPPLERLPPPH